MCGIIGCKLKRPLTHGDIERMRAMRDLMTHRGPDGAGEYILEQEGLFLGHRRLSIIDPEPRSAQPYIDDQMVITYNGEIYNYLELREELSAYTKFETSGDTEVLIKAWRQWGASCLDKLDGMYAFAIKDKNGLHIVTDVFGEKPLYIHENSDGIYFASEPAPLIKILDLKWKPSHSDLNDFLNLGYIRPPYTGFEGLENIAPASHITIHPNNLRTAKTYWTITLPQSCKGSVRPFEETQINDVRDLLCSSLEKRLRSDVPIGLFLSGGIDSALIAALATKELGTKLHSYTVSFADKTDESEYASKIANYLGMPHTLIASHQDSAIQNAPHELLNLYGVLNDNTTGFAVSKMCKNAKDHLTVALSGLGGDELFFGYNKYDYLYKNRMLYDLSSHVQSLLPALAALPFSKTQTAAKMLQGTIGQQFLQIKNGLAQQAIIQMGYGDRGDFWEWDNEPYYSQARKLDLICTMPQSYIPAVDRGSMQHSVEVRTPFLNRKLLNYILTLDQRALIHFGKKNLLQSMVKRYMPLDLLTPRKQGFVYPLSSYSAQSKESFSLPTWVRNPDEIINNAKAGQQGYERLILRLCMVAELEKGK